MLRVVDRYIFRELIAPFLLGGSLFTFFLFIDRIYHLTELVITKGVPLHLVLQLLAYMLPAFLAHTLPMALLVAILITAGRLAGDLEVIAFKAAGVSPLRLFAPVLAAATLVGLATAVMTLGVNPNTNAAFQRQLFRILQSRASAGLQERVFNTDFAGTVVYIEELASSGDVLKGLLVSDERDPKRSRIITASEGRLLTDDKNRRVTLRLLDGTVSEGAVAPAAPGAGEATGKPGRFVTPSADGDGRSRYRHVAFSVYDMSLTLDSPLKVPARLEKPERDVATADLARTVEQLRREGGNVAPYEVEYHKRFALPAAAIVFALLGFPLAIRSHRGGRSLALASSLVILVTYYLLLTFFEDLALSRRLPAWLAIWLPNLLFTGLGAGVMYAVVQELPLPELPRLRALFETGRSVVANGRRRGPAAPAPPRDSTHLVDRYLVREYLVYIAFGSAVAAVLFVIVDFLSTLDKYLRVKPPLAFILQHFVYAVPLALHRGFPIVVLVATLFLFLALSRHHELTALKAAGVSLYRVSLPILALGALFSLGAGVFQEMLLPALNARGDEVDRVKIRGQLPKHLQVRTRLWVRSAETRFFRVELIDPAARDLFGVTVLELDKAFQMRSRLDTPRLRWTDHGWLASHGALREFGADRRVRTVPFAERVLDMPERIEDFIVIQKPVAAMSYVELRQYITKLEESGHHARQYLVELHSKLSFPLVNLVMVLVAIPFAVHAPRGGRLLGIALAVGIMAGYLVLHYAAIAFARADLLPPLMAAWTANVVFVGLGASLLMRAPT